MSLFLNYKKYGATKEYFDDFERLKKRQCNVNQSSLQRTSKKQKVQELKGYEWNICWNV